MLCNKYQILIEMFSSYFTGVCYRNGDRYKHNQSYKDGCKTWYVIYFILID